MKLEHCAETRIIKVTGALIRDGRPVPTPTPRTDHCILPAHAGGHIWDSEARR